MQLGRSLLGKTLRVVGYHQDSPRVYRQKLLALGLTPDTLFVLKRVAPLGDPMQIEVRGSQISIRRREAVILEVEECA